MNITLNGKEHRLQGEATIESLLASLALKAGQVAVEKNRTIIPRSTYGAEAINEGDEIEIVHFIGGG